VETDSKGANSGSLSQGFSMDDIHAGTKFNFEYGDNGFKLAQILAGAAYL